MCVFSSTEWQNVDVVSKKKKTDYEELVEVVTGKIVEKRSILSQPPCRDLWFSLSPHRGGGCMSRL